MVTTLNIWKDIPEQTVMILIRLLPKKQSDQGQNCLPFSQIVLEIAESFLFFF